MLKNCKSKNVKQILLADDDSLSLRVLTYYLDEAGYVYVEAEDGRQAWDYLQKFPYKFFVVLADNHA